MFGLVLTKWRDMTNNINTDTSRPINIILVFDQVTLNEGKRRGKETKYFHEKQD